MGFPGLKVGAACFRCILEQKLIMMEANPRRGPDLIGAVAEVLRQRPDQHLTARQIAEFIRDAKPEGWAAKQQRAGHSDTEARNQIVAEIGAHRHALQRRHPEVTWFEEPRGERVRRQFAWVAGTEQEKDTQAEAAAANVAREGISTPEPGVGEVKLREVDLYPKLGTWLLSEFDIRSMRLDENRTAAGAVRGANWNRWLFPDIVGVEDLRDGWHTEMREFANKHGAPRCRLWSFEVKLLVNRANLRDCYLQAVSNSSWANRGYLVAAEISSEDITRDELAILAETHGIGAIELDLNDIANSRIIVPAKERVKIDWRACERLFSANFDFQVFIKKVLWLHQTNEFPSTGWLVDIEDAKPSS